MSTCNICLGDIKEDVIENICDCNNMKYHSECIKKWINCKENKERCEICNTEYNIRFEKYQIPHYLDSISCCISLIVYVTVFTCYSDFNGTVNLTVFFISLWVTCIAYLFINIVLLVL